MRPGAIRSWSRPRLMRSARTGVPGALQLQLAIYPESTLRDIYKSFFQDEFGPGHLLEDPEKARLYFEQELKSAESRGRRRAEACGRGRNFCRVPLDLVIDGIIPKEVYFSAFISGAADFRLPEIETWKRKWSIILGILRRQDFYPAGFDGDSAEIARVLNEGRYAMHHSSRYRSAYAPHYRIFSRDRLGLLSLPQY